jgi:phosphonoacetaldehyde hydrolase
MNRIEAVIFDWAGTTVDHGSLAPVRAVTELFRQRGLVVTDADARKDMGIFKRDHIARILAMPHVASQWRHAHRTEPDDDDVDRMFADFVPLQMRILEEYSEVIAGVAAVTRRLRARHLRIGSTTGYARPMLDVVLERARAQGYEVDAALCPDDVGGGRPRPWMCLQIAQAFRVSATAAVVKVGDTVSDVEEALNAGMWAVGVAATGNEIGLSAGALAALSDEDRQRRLVVARERLKAAGAHYVIDCASDIDAVVDAIDGRVAAGHDERSTGS